MVQTAGYSGKPLYQKLGIKPGMTRLSMRAPDHYTQLVHGVEAVRVVRRATPAEIVHAFCAVDSDRSGLKFLKRKA